MTHKSFLRSVSLIGLFLVGTLAASAQMRIGHCDDDPQTSTLRHNSTTSTISCAIALTPSMMSAYTYTDISHVRVALTAPEQLSSLQIWVRHSLSDATPAASANIDLTTLTAGWNSLALDHPVSIDATSTLYCGYSYTQSEPTYLATSGKKGKSGSFWIGVDGEWTDYSKKAEPICIQAELSSHYSQAMFLSDYGLDQASVSGNTEPPSLQLAYSFTNAGRTPISQYALSYSINDGDEQSLLVDCSAQPVAFGQRGTASHTIVLPEGLRGLDNTLRFTLSAPNGHENEYSTACSGTLYFQVEDPLPTDSSTPLLIEEFTSLDNGYAPAGQQHLRQAIALSQRPVLLISRHEGYGPNDTMHCSGSDYSADFFGPDKLTFVPAAWIERQHTPFSTTLPADSIAQLIEQTDIERHGIIRFDSVSYDDSERLLTATFDVELRNIAGFSNPTLIVCLTQDEASTPEQKNYYPADYEGSSQSHAIRCFAKLASNGSLFQNANADDIRHGRVPLAQYARQRLISTLLLPQGLPIRTNGWHLVAYITERGENYRILAANSLSINLN